MDKLIDYKRTYVASDGEKYVFMGGYVYNVDNLKATAVARVNQDEEGRIDTFTYNSSLSNDDIDLVMYINHIFNPFAIKEGDIIYQPGSDNYYYSSTEPTMVDGSKHSDSETATKQRTYAETVEYLAKLGLGLK